MRVLACLAEGLGIRATARVFEVEANTVLHWLIEAAEQLRAFSRYFLCDVHLEQLQLDELYAVLRDLKAGEINDDEAISRLERAPSWVWTAMDPTSKFLVVVDIGTAFGGLMSLCCLAYVGWIVIMMTSMSRMTPATPTVAPRPAGPVVRPAPAPAPAQKKMEKMAPAPGAPAPAPAKKDE